MSETQLVKSILEAVNHYGYFWRNNTGATRIGDGRSARFVRYGLPGSADIIGVCQGRFIAIEVKTRTGRQSDTQREFQRHVEQHGGVYVLARSVDDAVNRIRSNNPEKMSNSRERLKQMGFEEPSEEQRALNKAAYELNHHANFKGK